MSDIIPEGILYGNLGVGSGTTNYNDLDNKPQINSVTLQGNKTASELGLVGTSDIPVTSVNGETGAVVLDGTEIEFSTGVSLNEKIIAVENEIPVIAYPVTSVNGETGAVVIDGTEINYQAGKTINQKIDEVEAEIPVISYPVTSVNNKTGAVVLDGTDIEYSSGVSVNSQIDTLMNYIPVYGNTASGAIATFDTSLALPLQDLQIAINAVQESGTPTPSTPKLISGFTGANIHVADDETPHVIDNVTTISWNDEAGTVYGGSLDVTSGVLTVTHESVDLGSLTWTYDSQNQRFNASVTDIKTYNAVRTNPFICSDFQTISDGRPIAQVPNYSIYNGQNKNIHVHDTDYTDAGQFTTAVSGVLLVYELATPVTYQLTPTQISAIVGTNNIFTDTNGDTSVVYACSLKDYIDSQ